jgi:PIN domain nuclease of toxin-antitoxin system
MKVLVDTHAFLWYVLNDPQLSTAAQSAIVGKTSRSDSRDFPIVLVSPASYWEVAIKVSLGKYALTVPYEMFWRRGIDDNGFSILPITIAHTAALAALPFHHKDPFDRLLVAQALVENVPLVSNDPALDAYGIKRIW